MAYSIRLTGIAKSDGSELLSIEPHWWSVDELKRHTAYEWKVSNDTGSYRDEDTDISINEARRLREIFKPVVERELKFNVECIESIRKRPDEYSPSALTSYTDYVAKLQAELDLIDRVVGVDAGKFARFHLCVFEWESGF